jgi:hypothetical protein
VRQRIGALTAACATATLALAVLAAGSSAKTVWLCLPGHSPDPCTPGLSTTAYTPSLTRTGVEHPTQVKHPAIDCFYVYPTVSGQPTGNANLNIDPEERSVALYQAGRYSQYCRVFAPMYRQLTLAGIGNGTPTTTPDPAIALADVRNAFKTYLRNYNHGRGFVLIGHSQGSFVLRTVIAKGRGREARGPQAARVGDPARWQRHGPQGESRRRRLQAHPGVPL